jgi:hypothetical protein
MKKLIVSLLLLTACGGGSGGEDTSSSSIITNCGNRSDVSITCNIGDDEAGTDAACNKCGDNYIQCISEPEDNGLTDDTLCNDIYATCKEINGCEVVV